MRFVNFGPSCHKLVIVTLASLIVYSCRRSLDIAPPNTSLSSENVYHSDVSAAAVLTGLYINMYKSGFTSGQSGISTISGRAGLSADELTLFSGSTNEILRAHYRNDLYSQLIIGPWKECYTFIQTVNSVLEGLEYSSLTVKVKNQIEGEAKFLRAFFYFYLVNFYGGVPIITISDWRANASVNRASKNDVWQQILADLEEAKVLLSEDYLNANLTSVTIDRVRPTKWAALALLARVHLYLKDWTNAEINATAVLNKTSLYDTVSLATVFLKNSKESIWQIMPVNANRNTEDATIFLLTGAPNSAKPVFLNSFLFNSFEAGDQRKVNWVASKNIGSVIYYYPFKYKADAIPATTPSTAPTEYLTVIRLAEMYLIRAEARVNMDNINGGKDDLNMIRNRARLPGSASSSKVSLLNEILHERQVELFTEWGHRWLDLIRTGSIDSVMNLVTPVKAVGSNWRTYQQLYPIHNTDLQLNPNLNQNLGY